MDGIGWNVHTKAFGNFYRLLAPGSYRLVIEAPGFCPHSFDVVLTKLQPLARIEHTMSRACSNLPQYQQNHTQTRSVESHVAFVFGMCLFSAALLLHRFKRLRSLREQGV